MNELELKGIIEWITEQIDNILNLESLAPELDALTTSKYQDGMEKLGVKLDMNFIPQEDNLRLLQETMVDNIKNQGMEITHNIKGELKRWKLNDESVAQAKTRIREAMKKGKWSHKVKRVVRTETQRANNMGTLDGAKQSGLDLKKWIDITDDKRTSNICKKEHAKYGSKENAIALDKEFIVKVDNKTYRAQAPPFHPNCRSVLRIVRVEE